MNPLLALRRVINERSELRFDEAKTVVYARHCPACSKGYLQIGVLLPGGDGGRTVLVGLLVSRYGINAAERDLLHYRDTYDRSLLWRMGLCV